MTPESIPDIVVTAEPLDPSVIRVLVDRFFTDMVKYVADVRRGVLAVGGELHADAEGVLLEAGSRQEDLWGANYYPGAGEAGCIEFTSLINIRPSQDNPSMEIQSEKVRERVRSLTFRILGQGEPLA